MSITKSSGNVKIGDLNLDYDLIRIPRRKSLRIKILNKNKIELRCAKNVKWNVISDFVHSKEKWIRNRLAILEDSCFLRFPDNFEDQEILYQGENVEIKLIHRPQKKYNIELIKKQIHITAPVGASSQNIRRKLEKFYKSQLLSLVNTWIENLEVTYKPSKIAIRNYKAKWGSTNSDRQIYLNTYLLMLPIHLIEYVFYHEISHLVELNHSPKYKRILSSFLPNYKELKQEMKLYRLRK